MSQRSSGDFSDEMTTITLRLIGNIIGILIVVITLGIIRRKNMTMGRLITFLIIFSVVGVGLYYMLFIYAPSPNDGTGMAVEVRSTSDPLTVTDTTPNENNISNNNTLIFILGGLFIVSLAFAVWNTLQGSRPPSHVRLPEIPRPLAYRIKIPEKNKANPDMAMRFIEQLSHNFPYIFLQIYANNKQVWWQVVDWYSRSQRVFEQTIRSIYPEAEIETVSLVREVTNK